MHFAYCSLHYKNKKCDDFSKLIKLQFSSHFLTKRLTHFLVHFFTYEQYSKNLVERNHVKKNVPKNKEFNSFIDKNINPLKFIEDSNEYFPIQYYSLCPQMIFPLYL